ncbi:MAG TPA: metalloregulator ArsR/SmtB family transcription factor [Solirubrobacteraceae bacterium]|nr:metalloregulator ArsR/SmtB family transcription factor [Solirubrobacteraceae bacterium]
MDALSPELAELIARRFAVLSDPVRVRMLDAMHTAGELSVGELADVLGASHANVSKHLQLMLAERLVSRRREGARVYYRISDPNLIVLCEEVCSGVRHTLRELRAIVEVSTQEA